MSLTYSEALKLAEETLRLRKENAALSLRAEVLEKDRRTFFDLLRYRVTEGEDLGKDTYSVRVDISRQMLAAAACLDDVTDRLAKQISAALLKEAKEQRRALQGAIDARNGVIRRAIMADYENAKRRGRVRPTIVS